MMMAGVAGLSAQDFVCKIEAEDAELTSPVKVKEISDQHSGGKYVGDNDPGSVIEFKVDIPSAGTYEFRTHYMCGDDSRGIAVKVQNYQQMICKVPATTDDWNYPPTKMMSVNIYMDAGENVIRVTPYPNAGPNIDYFEIYTTKEVVLPEIEEFPKLYEAEDALLFGDLKVKPVDGSKINGLSGGRYVGDFNLRSNSYLILPKVEVPEAGTYRLEVHSMGSSRALSIKVNQYEPFVIRTLDSPDWNNAPTSVVVTLIYLDKGANRILFNSYNDDGPNIDCFKIFKTDEVIDRPAVKLISYAHDYTDDANLSAQYANETLSNINDNDEYTVYTVPGKTSATVTAVCDTPLLLTGYLLTAGVGNSTDVTAWTLESSQDGTAWTKVTPTKTTDISGAILFEVARQLATASATRARYYRLTATGETDVEIAEWQLFGSPYLDNTDGRSFPEDITEGLDMSACAMAWPEGNSGDGWQETFINLFDRKLTSKYCMADTKTYQVQFELPKSYRLDYYTLTSVDVDADRNPKKWTLNGYNEDEGWVELDRQKDYSFPCGYATMRFNISDSGRYSAFLLDVEDNSGSSYSQLLNWQLFGTTEEDNAVEAIASEVFICGVTGLTGRVKVTNRAEEYLHCNVMNIEGVSLLRRKVATGENYIDLPAGLYLVNMVGKNFNKTFKVIVR